MRVIARNEALRLVARRREDPLPEDFESASSPPAPVGPEARLDVARALSALSEDELRTVLLRYWSDKTDDQIARLAGIPAGTVKIRLHRARRKLAHELGAVFDKS